MNPKPRPTKAGPGDPACGACGHPRSRHAGRCDVRGCKCATYRDPVPFHVREANRLGLPVAAMVPGTGMDWPGAARMAAARRAAGLYLDERDREALRRYPTPESSTV